MIPASSSRYLISVVDDDESVRESLEGLLTECGFDVRVFTSAEQFLVFSEGTVQTNCLLLDVALPWMSGPELQCELARRGNQIPIIFITAQVDHTLKPRLIAQGAVDCLVKPFSDTALLVALGAALGGAWGQQQP